MIPENYDEWRNCIINQCNITMTKEFVTRRLMIYRNLAHPETIRFVQQYGQKHLKNIINWFNTYAKQSL